MVRSQGVFGIDMVVEMPKSMFQEKDYRDLRYFQKRAYFIANIAAKVKGSPGLADVQFAYLNDNPLLPILSITPPPTEMTPMRGIQIARNGQNKTSMG